MLKALLIIYFGIGFAFALFMIARNKAPFKTLLFYTFFGPIIFVAIIRSAIKGKKVKIGD